MSNASNVHEALGRALATGDCLVRNPGTGNTCDMRGMQFPVFVASAGTYKLPTLPSALAGTHLTVVATGNVTITDAASSTLTTLVSGQTALLISTTSSWGSSTVFGAGADDFTAMVEALVAENAATLGATYNSASTLVGFQQQVLLPEGKFTTSATTSTVTPAGADFSGARHVVWDNTANGALALTTPTAAAMYTAHINGGPSAVGHTYYLYIVNRGDNTITITGGSNVTVTGTNTVATKISRCYLVTLTSATALTMRSVNRGTID